MAAAILSLLVSHSELLKIWSKPCTCFPLMVWLCLNYTCSGDGCTVIAAGVKISLPHLIHKDKIFSLETVSDLSLCLYLHLLEKSFMVKLVYITIDDKDKYM